MATVALVEKLFEFHSKYRQQQGKCFSSKMIDDGRTFTFLALRQNRMHVVLSQFAFRFFMLIVHSSDRFIWILFLYTNTESFFAQMHSAIVETYFLLRLNDIEHKRKRSQNAYLIGLITMQQQQQQQHSSIIVIIKLMELFH